MIKELLNGSSFSLQKNLFCIKIFIKIMQQKRFADCLINE